MVEWLFSIREDGSELARVYAGNEEDALALVLSNPKEYGDLGGKKLEAVRVEEGGRPLQKLEN